MNSLSVDEQFILKDLNTNHAQASWDWEADERFADHLGEDSLINAAIESCAPSACRIAASLTWKHITNRRLRVLRKLVKKGYCESFWIGTGQFGKNDFGVNRIRTCDVLNKHIVE